MNITVIGTGNVGCTLSADLTRKGHRVSLVKTSSLINKNFDFIERNRSFRVLDKYVGDYTVDYYEVYNQEYETILIEPGYLSTCYLLKY